MIAQLKQDRISQIMLVVVILAALLTIAGIPAYALMLANNQSQISLPIPTPTVTLLQFDGDGDKIIPFIVTRDGPTRFGFVQYGDDNFIVHLLRSDGSWVRGLVNDGNKYTGEKIEKLEAGSYNLEITTSGHWTVIILPPQ